MHAFENVFIKIGPIELKLAFVIHGFHGAD
jgi:hypothetical protein